MRCKTVSEIINAFPTSLREIIGHIRLPGDHGAHLAQTLRYGKLVGASDGSLLTHNQQQIGGHSYSLQAWETDKNNITGYAVTPHSPQMSSTTTELYGLLGAVLSVFLITSGHNITSSKCPITIYADNEQAINKAKQLQPPLNISETDADDYDIWRLMIDIQQHIPIKLHFQWTKGHQNEHNGKLIYGPFPRDVQLNIKMDELAKRGAHESKARGKSLRRPVYSTTILSFYDKNNQLIQNIRKYITYNLNAPQMIQYMEKKFGWDSNIR